MDFCLRDFIIRESFIPFFVANLMLDRKRDEEKEYFPPSFIQSSTDDLFHAIFQCHPLLGVHEKFSSVIVLVYSLMSLLPLSFSLFLRKYQRCYLSDEDNGDKKSKGVETQLTKSLWRRESFSKILCFSVSRLSSCLLCYSIGSDVLLFFPFFLLVSHPPSHEFCYNRKITSFNSICEEREREMKGKDQRKRERERRNLDFEVLAKEIKERETKERKERKEDPLLSRKCNLFSFSFTTKTTGNNLPFA